MGTRGNLNIPNKIVMRPREGISTLRGKKPIEGKQVENWINKLLKFYTTLVIFDYFTKFYLFKNIMDGCIK